MSGHSFTAGPNSSPSQYLPPAGTPPSNPTQTSQLPLAARISTAAAPFPSPSPTTSSNRSSPAPSSNSARFSAYATDRPIRPLPNLSTTDRLILPQGPLQAKQPPPTPASTSMSPPPSNPLASQAPAAPTPTPAPSASNGGWTHKSDVVIKQERAAPSTAPSAAGVAAANDTSRYHRTRGELNKFVNGLRSAGASAVIDLPRVVVNGMSL